MWCHREAIYINIPLYMPRISHLLTVSQTARATYWVQFSLMESQCHSAEPVSPSWSLNKAQKYKKLCHSSTQWAYTTCKHMVYTLYAMCSSVSQISHSKQYCIVKITVEYSHDSMLPDHVPTAYSAYNKHTWQLYTRLPVALSRKVHMAKLWIHPLKHPSQWIHRL